MSAPFFSPPVPPHRHELPVSWEDLHRAAKTLAWRLLPLGPWRGLIAVSRGGLVPAAIVARELDIRLVETICLASYQHQNQGEVQVLKAVEGDGSGWLVIDDLVDTGQTAIVVRRMLPKAHLASIYAKPAGRPRVDTFITEVEQDTWIFFPWDIEPRFSPPIVERHQG